MNKKIIGCCFLMPFLTALSMEQGPKERISATAASSVLVSMKKKRKQAVPSSKRKMSFDFITKSESADYDYEKFIILYTTKDGVTVGFSEVKENWCTNLVVDKRKKIMKELCSRGWVLPRSSVFKIIQHFGPRKKIKYSSHV